jgi:mycothiol synthase
MKIMNTKFSTPETTLDPSLSLRSVSWEDVKSVAQLILDVCIADGDPAITVTEEELSRFWGSSDFNIETDAWVVETREGKIVGYQEFYCKQAHAAMVGDGYVHPEFHELGIGTAMLRTLERRARQEMELAQPGRRVFIRNGVAGNDAAACELHENEGYQAIRFSWHMEIQLEVEPHVPAFPDGIELRPFLLDEHNHTLYEAHEEAFSDHWGHVLGTFESWNHHVINRENFDSTLFFIAWDGDQIAGYSLCRYRMGSGWVGSLGVRRLWRKRGLGEALLLHSFQEFYKRGTRTIGLGVDAQNPTGATRLYTKAGMHVASESVVYEKELRTGCNVDDEQGE